MAIAFDAGSTLNDFAGATATQAHTCTGSNRYLFALVFDFAGLVTGATYNTVAMTQLATATFSAETLRLFGLINPASGANNIVVTSSSGSGSIRLGGMSYSGAPGGANVSQGSNATTQSSPYTTSLTTTADNSWVIRMTRGSAGMTASTGSTFRISDNGSDGRFTEGYDTGGAVTPAGSKSMSVTYAGSSQFAAVMAALSPTAVVNNGGFFFAAAAQ